MPVPASALRPHPDCPLVVPYSPGVDSTGMLVELARQGIDGPLVFDTLRRSQGLKCPPFR